MDYIDSKDSTQNIAGLFGRANKEALVRFLVEYAEHDPKFANAVNVRFCKPEFEEEFLKIEKKINQALKGVSDYRTHDRWGYVFIDVGDIVVEICERAEQGHIRLAFTEIELLYRRMLEHFEYQGECEISDKAEDCLAIMSDIADKAVLDDDKDFIFKKCIELSELDDGKDYGADYEDKLLGISAKFVSSANRLELENALSRFESMHWRGEGFKLIQLEIIQKIDGEDTADIFISENLRFPKFREIAFEKAMLCHRFDDAEKLCVDALSNASPSSISSHLSARPWLHKLYSVYETTGNVIKMIETARDILFNGNIDYYDILKSLLISQSAFEKSYSDLLLQCKLKLSSSQYMAILSRENELTLLMEEVQVHTEHVYPYGKLLANRFMVPVREVFIEQLNKEAEHANGRDSYARVCSRISVFADAGYYAEAIELVREYKVRFKRKPAFVDELSKILLR